jgi:O-antigen/teichoic acid export membrane protein
VLQAVAAFTIALAISRAGLDTTAVWLLPRVAEQEPGRVRVAVLALLLPSLLFGTFGAAALWWVGSFLDAREPDLGRSLVLMAGLMPFATVMTVGLGATRGLGGVRTYVLIGSVGVPAVRPLLVLVSTAAAAGTTGAALAWASPLPVAAALVAVLLLRTVRQHEQRHTRAARTPGAPRLARRVAGYALPRWVSTALEQSMQWLDVLLVGALAGPTAAGIYGAASRLVAAGLVLSTALRIVVAPLYSRSLGGGRVGEAQSLYTTTTTWMVLFSTPVFIVLATYGGTVLGLFGPGFRTGADALLILAVGLLTVLVAGNVQSLLLMSGHSGLAAVNKAAALAVTLTGIVLAVPRWGIEGAALAWSAGMVLDAVLAVWQVHRYVGVRPLAGRVHLALAVALGSVGLPALVSRWTLDDTMTGLAVTLLVGGTCLLLACFILRRQLLLDDILALVRLRRR